MKKGVQYSHYCGTELLELVSSIRLSMDLVDENRKESKEWSEYALKMVSKLRDKILSNGELNEQNIEIVVDENPLYIFNDTNMETYHAFETEENANEYNCEKILEKHYPIIALS